LIGNASGTSDLPNLTKLATIKTGQDGTDTWNATHPSRNKKVRWPDYPFQFLPASTRLCVCQDLIHCHLALNRQREQNGEARPTTLPIHRLDPPAVRAHDCLRQRLAKANTFDRSAAVPRYTAEPLAARTDSAPVAAGASQHAARATLD
jgi:hypothetical protein